MTNKETDELILMGVISGAHGIKGQVLVRSFAENPTAIGNLPLQCKDGKEYTLSYVRNHSSGGIVCNVEGIDTRTEAEGLAKTELYIRRSELPAPGENEFYYSDLVGMDVIDENKEPVGKIIAIYDHGAGDVIEIQFKESRKKLQFPFTKELFPQITKEYAIFTGEEEN